jgi:hypothetical protein
MMMPRSLRKLPCLRTLAMAGAAALALSAPMALAQADPGGGGAGAAGASNPNQGGAGNSAAGAANPGAANPGAANPGNVSGVIVEAPPRPENPPVPPDKAAGYAKEAAKAEAWRSYRGSLPPLSDGTLGQAKDYPGAQSLLPHPEESPSGR